MKQDKNTGSKGSETQTAVRETLAKSRFAHVCVIQTRITWSLLSCQKQTLKGKVQQNDTQQTQMRVGGKESWRQTHTNTNTNTYTDTHISTNTQTQTRKHTHKHTLTLTNPCTNASCLPPPQKKCTKPGLSESLCWRSAKQSLEKPWAQCLFLCLAVG